MKLKHPPQQTLANFSRYLRSLNDTPTKLQLQHFLHTNFESAGREFEDWIPEDWKPKPRFVNKIRDAGFRQWALELNFMWKRLGRKMKQEVRENEELYSIIWIPNPVIVPGGRFREYYYWDSYWILKGKTSRNTLCTDFFFIGLVVEYYAPMHQASIRTNV